LFYPKNCILCNHELTYDYLEDIPKNTAKCENCNNYAINQTQYIFVEIIQFKHGHIANVFLSDIDKCKCTIYDRCYNMVSFNMRIYDIKFINLL